MPKRPPYLTLLRKLIGMANDLDPRLSDAERREILSWQVSKRYFQKGLAGKVKRAWELVQERT